MSPSLRKRSGVDRRAGNEEIILPPGEGVVVKGNGNRMYAGAPLVLFVIKSDGKQIRELREHWVARLPPDHPIVAALERGTDEQHLDERYNRFVRYRLKGHTPEGGTAKLVAEGDGNPHKSATRLVAFYPDRREIEGERGDRWFTTADETGDARRRVEKIRRILQKAAGAGGYTSERLARDMPYTATVYMSSERAQDAIKKLELLRWNDPTHGEIRGLVRNVAFPKWRGKEDIYDRVWDLGSPIEYVGLMSPRESIGWTLLIGFGKHINYEPLMKGLGVRTPLLPAREGTLELEK